MSSRPKHQKASSKGMEHPLQKYYQANPTLQKILGWLSFGRVSILFYVVALFIPVLSMQEDVMGNLLKPKYIIGLECLLFGWGSGYFWAWFSNLLYFTILIKRAPKAILFVLSVISIMLALELREFTQYIDVDFRLNRIYHQVDLEIGYIFWISSYLICSMGLFLGLARSPFIKRPMNPPILFKGKNLFLIDALVSFGMAYILAGLLAENEKALGIPQGVFFGLAALECWVGVYSLWCFFWVKPFNPKLMRQLAFYNLCNAIIAIGLLILMPMHLKFSGVLFILFVVILILALANREWKASKGEV